MKKTLFAAAFVLAASSAFAAETIKASVGHMCCGACKAGATKGLQSVAWIDGITIDNDVVTVTAKGDQKADLVSLTDALNKAGFPAREIMVSGPVTMNVAHLCCAGCVNDLKTKLVPNQRLAFDKDKLVVDAAAKTVTVQPEAGKTMNIVALMRVMANAGFAASKATVAAGATTSTK